MQIDHWKKIILFCIIVIGMIFFWNKVFLFRDLSVWSTDARVADYKKLPTNSLDVLFVGSSNIMCGINPLQLWKETGIHSYNYCSRAQTLPFTYAYIKDAIRTQKPKYLVIDVFSVIDDKPVYGLANNDTHFRINMDSLSMSMTKINLINTYVPKEARIGCVIPLIRNHNDYKEWSLETDCTDNIFMGYCYADDVSSFDTPEYTNAIENVQEIDRIYMQKIIQLCYEIGSELIVIKTPVVCEDSVHSRLNGLAAILGAEDIPYYDMSLNANEFGFDFGTDMRDGLHVNSSGAEKITAYMGKILTEKDNFNDYATDGYEYIWEKEYERMREIRAVTGNGE